MALLGIDIGTSGCKALVLSPDGEILASHTATYGLSQPCPGWTEQEPADWVDGASAAVAAILEKVPAQQIEAVGLSGQMHGFTPLDADGKVVRPAILWNDQRNAAEAAEIEGLAGGGEALRGHTNNQMLVGYTGGKILWMQRHEPDLFEKVAHALNPKDYLRLVLTGEYATEVSDASGTGLFDVRKRCWATRLLDKLPFDGSILPQCHESEVVSGKITSHGSQIFGLPAGVPVIGGGGDAVIQTLGSGVAGPGFLQTTVGTAGITAAALQAPEDNPNGRLQIFCNVAPDLWHCMGVSLNAGGALAWLRTCLGGNATFDDMVAGAAEVDVGAGGLIFLPYLNGERCPHPDPSARGGFIGLTSRHDVRHMTRAVLEGVALALFDMYRLMERMGKRTELVKTSGGGARSDLWRQIQADLFNCPVVTVKGAAEGGAFGAALLAGVSQRAWSDVDEAAKCCFEMTRNDPVPAHHGIYRSIYKVYAGLYEDLHASFHTLSTLEGV